MKSAEHTMDNLGFEENLVSEEELLLSEGENSIAQGNQSVHISDFNIEAMVAPRQTMVEYARRTLGSTGSCIVKPTIEANNFEIKASTMNMIHNQCQFDGLVGEDPHADIQMFLDIREMVKQNGVLDEALKLHLFPFTLKGKTR